MIFVSYVYTPATNQLFTKHMSTVCNSLEEFKKQTIGNATCIGEITIISWQEVTSSEAATLLRIKKGE